MGGIQLMKWIVINYKLPSEPSRVRVATWRSLKKLGAVNIQQSMWVLPSSKENYAALSAISEELENNNGNALIMESIFLEEKYEQRVVAYFNKAREIEYYEIIDKCNDYFAEIKKEIARENFTFAEAEENEEELEKLLAWFEKIKVRDVFEAPLRDETEGILEDCKSVFEDFCLKVYENEK
jgi:hypothetical protein